MAAKADNSLLTLLSNLTASLTSASEIVPAQDAALPPKDGISLLDVKNELLLSYLQNLVFLIVLKLRNNDATANNSDNKKDEADINDEVVKKLCELRLYLEKGARPLEGKLKYQIDKVVRAAEDAARAEAQKNAPVAKAGKKQQKGVSHDDEDSEDDEDGSDASEDDEDEDANINELAYRPNPAAFSRPAAAAADKSSNKKAKEESSDGIYRPPRITATAMPELREESRRERSERGGPRRAAAIDEFVDEHLSAAPVAQPSIGSNVVAGGRHVKSARERAEEDERRAYEETNFVRLPKVGKKERAKQKANKRGGFGGEEWHELSAGVDRIERLTHRKERGGAAGALDRSRKRAAADGGGAGAEAGAMFAKRRKMQSRRK